MSTSKSMNCQEVQSLISEYSLGLIEGRRKAEMDQHLASCKACARELEKLTQVMALVEGLDAKEPPPGLWNGVYNRISQPETSRHYGWARKWSIGFATAVLAMILLFAHIHNPGVESTYAANEYVQGHAVYATQDILADQAALNTVATIAYREQVGGHQ